MGNNPIVQFILQPILIFGVLGVAQGSVREPYFLTGQYNPDAKIQIALIGKGVLFDSGGLSLKSPSGMETMKTGCVYLEIGRASCRERV